MPRAWWKTKRHTRVSLDPNGLSECWYHDTKIVEWISEKGYGNYVFLTLGSRSIHDSMTTRRRMNEVAYHYGLGFRVFREKGESFVYAKTGHKCAKRRDRLSFHDYKVSFPLPREPKDCPDCALALLANA